MKTGTVLRKLRLENRDIVTSEELKEICSSLDIKYESAIRHLVPRGHLTRIFRGIFYVPTPDEALTKRQTHSHLELVSKGLKAKGVENWYFGLYTALKMNNMTHEHFTIEHVVNDKIHRANPMNIAGYSFKFVKIKPRLLGFGITDTELKHSDPEKTILDFIYLWRYNSIPDQKITLNVKEWTTNANKEKLKKYSRNYPKTVETMLEDILS